MKTLLCCVVLLSPYFAFSQTASPAPSSPSGEKTKVLWQKLGAEISDIDQHLDGVMGVAIEDLTTGEHFFLREDEVFAQASSIKITVLANLYLQVQQGKLKVLVDKVYKLADAREALRVIEDREVFGKIVVAP